MCIDDGLGRSRRNPQVRRTRATRTLLYFVLLLSSVLLSNSNRRRFCGETYLYTVSVFLFIVNFSLQLLPSGDAAVDCAGLLPAHGSWCFIHSALRWLELLGQNAGSISYRGTLKNSDAWAVRLGASPSPILSPNNERWPRRHIL